MGELNDLQVRANALATDARVVGKELFKLRNQLAKELANIGNKAVKRLTVRGKNM